MDVQEKLKSLQSLVNKTQLYQKIIDSNFFFLEKNRNIMNIFKDQELEIADSVLKELIDFAKMRMEEISSGNHIQSGCVMPEGQFTEEEIRILKNLVQSIKAKAVPQNNNAVLPTAPKGLEEKNSHSDKEQKTPVQVASAQDNPRRLRNAGKIAELKKNGGGYITEDTMNRDPKEFIGRLTRTLGHSSLHLVGTKPVNPLETYSTVKIMDIKKDGNTWVADISFAGDGSKGQIDLTELEPWEYASFKD